MRYSLACLSDTGVVREHNEDNFAFFGNVMPFEHQSSDVYAMDTTDDDSFAVAVFDGMGGGAAGEAASFAAAESLGEYVRGVNVWDQSSILSAYECMNSAVLDAAIAEKAPSMGATAVMLTSSHGNSWVSNLGDSPALLYDGSRLVTLTVAHTDEGLMNALGISGRRPGLTQYLGIDTREMTIEPYLIPVAFEPGCCLLLCSDGLTDMVSNVAVQSVLMKEEPARRKALELRDLAREHGGKDNITVIVCDVLPAEGACHD